MADPNQIEPIEITGEDPEIDYKAIIDDLYQPGERSGRKMSETFVEFVEKVGEGARRLSEHVHEDGAAVVGYFGGGAKD